MYAPPPFVVDSLTVRHFSTMHIYICCAIYSLVSDQNIPLIVVIISISYYVERDFSPAKECTRVRGCRGDLETRVIVFCEEEDGGTRRDGTMAVPIVRFDSQECGSIEPGKETTVLPSYNIPNAMNSLKNGGA